MEQNGLEEVKKPKAYLKYARLHLIFNIPPVSGAKISG